MNYFDYFWKYSLSFKTPRMFQFSWAVLGIALMLGLVTAGLIWQVSDCTGQACGTATFLGVGVSVLVLFLVKLFTYLRRVVRYKFVRISFILTILGLVFVGLTLWKEWVNLTYVAASFLIFGGLLNVCGILKTLGHFKGKTFVYLGNDRVWIFPDKEKTWALLVAIDHQYEEELKSLLWGALSEGVKNILFTGKEGEWALQQGKKEKAEMKQSYVPQVEAALEKALGWKEEGTVLLVDLEGGTYWKKAQEFRDRLQHS